ncbi:protein-glutamate methylesterase/protein-glutamine glutaminase [Paractinoplanes brasiliensis]|uniref:Protein-glutamate methylesterase/protein-glutamine glutaminase n=1 Tax=Paractinoplanes brasiliensis TaxID=52695 RepID=A0A4R6JLE8_9ACTN|nr:chemotaxis response regulator protein-glutamate methylesterase [Actinoplanes brasiliensis]TDO36607.1 two-component system chemotaxis response regulator CheB [Actinoplanes brasiliensis]GID32426.1 chemotaxis response regulator protein-glutamate methylesterase 1 [Actinoplanes brasiliensis]
MTGRIGVLIVDDSAVVRQVLSTRLRENPGIDVVGAVPDPIFAMEHMNKTWPDVVVLDLEMPRMDGLTFLRKIMEVRPTPVVICSTLTRRSADISMEALAAGAVSVIAKPTTGLKKFIEDESGDIVAAVRAAAASAQARRTRTARAGGPAPAAPPSPPRNRLTAAKEERLIAIGTSTGGTQALEVVLPALAPGGPGVVVVQHMPEKFTAAFAARLDTMCRVRVQEAQDGDPVLPGHVLIAPGGRHLEVVRMDTGFRVRVFDGPPVNRHRPSVDVLFRSVAKAVGPGALGVIMTGMGDDGARGLLEMRRAGAYTVAQDEATCVVHGMPREAVALGAVDRESSLALIAEVIHQHG